MESIDILGRHWKYDCMGCSIANKEMDLPGGILYENESFLLHQDPNNPIPGFLIIAMKRHIQNISEFNRMELDNFIQILYKTRSVLNTFNEIEQYTIIQEERSLHFHLWLLPKYKWMENVYDGKINSIIPMLKYGKENWKTEKMVNDTLEMAKKVKELMNKQEGDYDKNRLLS